MVFMPDYIEWFESHSCPSTQPVSTVLQMLKDLQWKELIIDQNEMRYLAAA